MRVAAWCVGAAWAAMIVACGGSAPSAKSSASADPEADLDAAERRIVARFGPLAEAEARAEAPAADEPAPRPTLPAGPPEPSPEAASERPSGGADATSTEDDACEDACDALDAMGRASTRICALDPGAARCDRARRRTEAARARVESSCPACQA